MLPTVVLVFALIHVAVSSDELYKVPDHINIDEILQNDRLTLSYMNCVLGAPGAKCTPEGEKLKTTIPEALQTDCAKCNEKVKEQIKTVLRHVIKKFPKKFDELEEKFDKEKVYRNKYKEEFEKEGIKV